MFMLSFMSLVVRSVQLHLFADERIANMGKQNNRTIHLATKRGTILDRKGRTMALSLKVPSYFVDPHVFKPKQAQIEQLASLFNISSRKLLNRVKSGSRRFAWVNRFANPQIEEKVKALNIEGLHYVSEWKRFYPDKELAGQVLGFVGYEGKGLEGIERYYNDQLVQEERSIQTKKDGKGRTIYSEVAAVRTKKRSTHLNLSLDANLQYILEEKLAIGAEETKSESAVGVMMDPYSGEILAMASYPEVNPNQYSQYPMQHWRNRAVQEIFEPGSTFKIFTMAAALEKKALKPDQIFHCEEGSLNFGSKAIRNSIQKTWLDPEGILKYSNNVGSARIGLDLGAHNLYKAIVNYGFGQKTGLDFPGELKGLLSQYKSWQPMDVANISFGQGLGVTAVQMTAAAASFANGGYAVQPSMLQRSKEEVTLSKTKIVSDKTLEFIHKWMFAVTQKGGTGYRARVEGFNVAGKTGSAQIIDRTTGSYSNSDLFSSFIGFAPLEKPKYVLFIGYKKPKQYRHGGELAAPIFSAVMAESLQYAGIKPSIQEKEQTFMLAQEKSGADLKKEASQIDKDNLQDLKGLSLREVLFWASDQSFDVEIIGNGNVYSQRPDPGSSIIDLHKVKVYLSSSLGETKI
ncbi:MAG TPA: penicillin-binding transpeptidase domain-containing protein [Oligoflexia bacterium]|nr:penicillin-binding transpeptidase domain-containing protein [Oligoflexia bacterium]